MNLLSDEWIPVRPLEGSEQRRIRLLDLLCGQGHWELSLPRDDMELAALQLLVCITQVVFSPKDAAELRSYIAKPISQEQYDTAAASFTEWFQLDHAKWPFMQVRGVSAKNMTSVDKLMTGLSGSENCCFVNEPALASRLCGGCAAIALFNRASCSPSFGGGTEGGFKPGLRGSAPITTMVLGRHLRETIWLNVLHAGQLHQSIPWYDRAIQQKPTWVAPIKRRESIHAGQIGLARGLLWQPAHVEMVPCVGWNSCSSCGLTAEVTYEYFAREQFGYTVAGTWPHPHSPRITVTKKGRKQEKIPSFKTGIPAWTQLARFVVRKRYILDSVEGQQPAAVVLQARNQQMYHRKADNLHLAIGGYLADQARILERRHDGYILNHGWDRNIVVIDQIIRLALSYRDALYRSLYVFAHGRPANGGGDRALKGALRVKDKEENRIRIYLRKANDATPKDKKGRLYVLAEHQFFRRTESVILDTLARFDFMSPSSQMIRMGKALREASEAIFNETVAPYRHDPESIRTIAVTRAMLRKQLNDLEPTIT